MLVRLNKKQVIEAFSQELRQEIAVLVESATAAHGAATHAESKAEDKYDTRGLEASYLAGAQSKRAMERQQQLTQFEHMSTKAFGPDDAIVATALVGLSGKNGVNYYLLMPFGGGISVECQGVRVQCITPQSPLGEALLGKSVGDEIEVPVGRDTNEYEIVFVA